LVPGGVGSRFVRKGVERVAFQKHKRFPQHVRHLADLLAAEADELAVPDNAEPHRSQIAGYVVDKSVQVR
jgi:hypothetical protein